MQTTQVLTTAAEFDVVTVGDTVTWFDGWQMRSGVVAWMDEWRQVAPATRECTLVVRAQEPQAGWNIVTVNRHGDHGLYVARSTTTGAQVLAHGGTLDEFIQFRAEFSQAN